jgi:hypothetical protein
MHLLRCSMYNLSVGLLRTAGVVVDFQMPLSPRLYSSADVTTSSLISYNSAARPRLSTPLSEPDFLSITYFSTKSILYLITKYKPFYTAILCQQIVLELKKIQRLEERIINSLCSLSLSLLPTDWRSILQVFIIVGCTSTIRIFVRATAARSCSRLKSR